MRPLSACSRRTRGRQDRSARAHRRRLRARRRRGGLRSGEESAQLQNIVESIVKRRSTAPILVGIDTGGTFTDLVAIVGREVHVHKVLSTPADPADAVITGLREMLTDVATKPASVTYSSTVATNALLEKKGARVALFTNAGFEDLIEIGRQNRDDLYALAPSRPAPLVARAMRFGVAERTLFDGSIIKSLTRGELARIVRLAAGSGADAFAICLLHSYANPKGEEAIARALAKLGRPLSVSHRILAEYREYERFSTAVVNAYVAPRMSSHLKNLRPGSKAHGFESCNPTAALSAPSWR